MRESVDNKHDDTQHAEQDGGRVDEADVEAIFRSITTVRLQSQHTGDEF